VLDELVAMLNGVAYVAANVVSESVEVDDSGTAALGTTAVAGNTLDAGPLSLLELSAQAVARHCSCSTIEKRATLLDERLLRRVVYHAAFISVSCICLQLVMSGFCFKLITVCCFLSLNAFYDSHP